MRARTIVLSALGLAVASGVNAQGTPAIAYETFTLDNGLEFIVHQDHSVPVVHVEVWYDVGSAHEPEGRSGFAHLFEHMMFQETGNLEAGQITTMITSAGGRWNGTTNKDRTNYFETVPSNRLNLALWLEAERMHGLVVDQTNFEREREVVKEERRRSVDNQPYGASMMTLDTLSQDWEPYRHTVIGSMDDLDAATPADVDEFYRQFYVPNNAAVVVAGDVTVEEVRELAERYFAHIPRGPEIPALPPIPAPPRTNAERRVTLNDDKATLPLFMSAYTIPPHDHADTRALSLLSRILLTGESSRMNQRLVKEERAALQVFGGASSGMGPGSLSIYALPNQGVEVDRLEGLIWEELEKVLASGVTERELQKAKNQTRAGMIMGRQRVQSKAGELHHYRHAHGDIDEIHRDLGLFMDVTIDDVERVARKYIRPENRTVVITLPASPAT